MQLAKLYDSYVTLFLNLLDKRIDISYIECAKIAKEALCLNRF